MEPKKINTTCNISKIIQYNIELKNEVQVSQGNF